MSFSLFAEQVMSGKITGLFPVLILHQQNVCFGAMYLPFLSLVSSFVNGGNTDLGGLLGRLKVCLEFSGCPFSSLRMAVSVLSLQSP